MRASLTAYILTWFLFCYLNSLAQHKLPDSTASTHLSDKFKMSYCLYYIGSSWIKFPQNPCLWVGVQIAANLRWTACILGVGKIRREGSAQVFPHLSLQNCCSQECCRTAYCILLWCTQFWSLEQQSGTQLYIGKINLYIQWVAAHFITKDYRFRIHIWVHWLDAEKPPTTSTWPLLQTALVDNIVSIVSNTNSSSRKCDSLWIELLKSAMPLTCLRTWKHPQSQTSFNENLQNSESILSQTQIKNYIFLKMTTDYWCLSSVCRGLYIYDKSQSDNILF